MYGYDAISASIGSIPVDAGYVFGYVSGSSYIVWSQADFNRFTKATKEYIDQGNGTPWRTPTVIDVENGAHSPSDMPSLAVKYSGVKLYCNQSTLSAVYATGWRGKVWVAAPGSDAANVKAAVEHNFPGFEVFAVQDFWAQSYDRSTVFPQTILPPPPPPTVDINGFKVGKPTATAIPAVVGWWGSDGIVYRETVFDRGQWNGIKWAK